MKRFYFVLCLILIAIFAIPFNATEIYATSQQQVKVIRDCEIYTSPKINYTEEETGIVLELTFGEILYVSGDEVTGEDCDFTFYNVSITKEEIEYSGYVITNFVMDVDNDSLEKTLDPNAKTIRQAQIFATEDESSKLVINGTEVILAQYEDLKIIDGYDKNKEFHEIMFEEDGVIYTGYIKTSDLLVEGLNITVISVIFIFVIVGSIIFSIYWTTRRKRKKQAKKIKMEG